MNTALIRKALEAGKMCAEILMKEGGACGSEISEEDFPLIVKALDSLQVSEKESIDIANLKDLINMIRMKLERRFQVSDYLRDGFQEDPPARTVLIDVCQDVMTHVREIHALAERALAKIEETK